MATEAFLAAFIIGLSEIADKTQLVILGLALTYKSPFKVFLGALTAHSLLDGLAIALGAGFGLTLPFHLLKYIIGTAFILLGLWTLLKHKPKKTKKEKKNTSKGTAFAASFLTVALSEMGDKTQIAAGLLSARSLQPLAVLLGSILALSIAIGLNVFIGSTLAQKIPRTTIKTLTGILFILFGIATLVF